jgi:hypothetical protein
MPILTHYLNLADQTSSSLSNDYIKTPRKTAPENLSKHLCVIQLSDRKLLSFSPVTQVWPTNLLVTK